MALRQPEVVDGKARFAGRQRARGAVAAAADPDRLRRFGDGKDELVGALVVAAREPGDG